MNGNQNQNAFEFDKAITHPFQTAEKGRFVWRLIFWSGGALSVLYLILIPLLASRYPTFLEYNWLNYQHIFSDGPEPDPAMLFGAFSGIWPAIVLVFLLIWMVYAACEAALHRKLLLGQEHPRRPITFGRQELLVMLAQVTVYAIWIAVYTFGVFFLTMIAAFFAMISGVLGGFIAVLGVIALIMAICYVPVRLAPTAAVSVVAEKLQIDPALAATKGRFWWLLLAYLVVFVGGYIVLSVIMSLGMLIISGSGEFMQAFSGMGERNPREIIEEIAPRFKNPLVLLLSVVFVFIHSCTAMLWATCLMGIGSYAAKLGRINKTG